MWYQIIHDPVLQSHDHIQIAQPDIRVDQDHFLAHGCQTCTNKYKTSEKQSKWPIKPKVQPKIAYVEDGRVLMEPITKELLNNLPISYRG